MSESNGTVAIIGTGTIGSTLAAEFAAGGQDFLLAGRDQEATAQDHGRPGRARRGGERGRGG